jgi:opacity protein-like surface antigen
MTSTLGPKGRKMMRPIVWLLSVTLVSLSPELARGEMYLGGYAGAAFPDSADIEASVPGVASITAHDARWNTAAVVGGKLGYWLDPFPYVGLELEAFHLDPSTRPQTVSFTIDGEPAGRGKIGGMDASVTAVGLNILARWPGNRIQPYVGGGPAVFITRLEDSGRDGPSAVTPSGQEDTDTSVGVQALAGVKLFVTRHIAFFAEYKFTHHKVDVRFTDGFLGRTNVSTQLNTQYLNVGLSVHFSPGW